MITANLLHALAALRFAQDAGLLLGRVAFAFHSGLGPFGLDVGAQTLILYGPVFRRSATPLDPALDGSHGEDRRVFFMEIDSTSAAQPLSPASDGCLRVIPESGNHFSVYSDTRFFMVDRHPFGAIRLKLEF